jgi:hypothetical protein
VIGSMPSTPTVWRCVSTVSWGFARRGLGGRFPSSPPS